MLFPLLTIPTLTENTFDCRSHPLSLVHPYRSIECFVLPVHLKLHHVSADWRLLMNMKLSLSGRSTRTQRSYARVSGHTNHNNATNSSNSNRSSSSSNSNDNNSNNSLHISQRGSYGGWWWWWSGSFALPCHRRREFAYIAFVTPQTPKIIRREHDNVEGTQDYNQKGVISNDCNDGTIDGTTERKYLKDSGENDDSSKNVYPDEGLFYEEDGNITPPPRILCLLSFTFSYTTRHSEKFS